MIKENVSLDALALYQPEDEGYNQAQAMLINRAAKAVHATILELDDLFNAILAPAPKQERRIKRCESCTPRVRCAMHPSEADRRSIRRELFAVRENYPH